MALLLHYQRGSGMIDNLSCVPIGLFLSHTAEEVVALQLMDEIPTSCCTWCNNNIYFLNG
jgi:hypothetical protein